MPRSEPRQRHSSELDATAVGDPPGFGDVEHVAVCQRGGGDDTPVTDESEFLRCAYDAIARRSLANP